MTAATGGIAATATIAPTAGSATAPTGTITRAATIASTIGPSSIAAGATIAATTGAIIAPATARPDRKSAVSGKSVSVRVDLGGRRILKKKNYINHNYHT